uniref:G_PROTEIN_RECEP_F1_2 domain-containing protein n=1 Tax=Anisakis simplex TaxID=6269 RepID=A0A0M3KED9_ANISI
LMEEGVSCRMFSAIAAAPYESLTFAFVGIAIERCIATIAYKRYEKWRIPLIAFVLAPVTWLNVALIIRRSIIGSDGKAYYQPYCSTLTSGYVNFAKLFSYSIPVIVASFVLFVLVYVVCKRKLKLFVASKIDDLSSRYQLVENVKSTKLLAILSSVYTVLVLLTLGSVIAIAYLNISDLLIFAVLKEISSFSMPLYINIYSVIIFTQCNYIRQRATRLFTRRNIGQLRNGTTVAPAVSVAQHMYILERMWSSPYK